MPPSDCIHSAARKAWMIHATTKEQRHHRWHSLTLLGCIGGHVLRTRNGNTHPYTPLNSGRYGKATASIMEKKKAKIQIRRGRHAILTGLVNRNPNGPLD
ncbi:hypothetical protein QC763_603438 [Podospora pseudopauciseta]|uniref:Uncharacterized protein n=1 Tax=Podospora pseudopauciseta TaxID=2093780 RepID=A0ABR0H3Z5_9PEZI|nr:hypothetical protein QC763_603438 [Podospora pseudopauciseta]